MTKNKALGKGLSALMGETLDAQNEDSITTLDVKNLVPGNFQTRTNFDQDKIEELKTSIEKNGVILPLIVRFDPIICKYQIIAGERRWRASQAAGLSQVPVIIKEIDDKQAFEIGLIENIQRQNLNSVEEARGYKKLLEEYAYTQDSLAKSLGKSRSHISNMIRILQLPEEVLSFISQGKLSAGHARALVTAQEPLNLAKKIIDQGLSVRQAEKFASGSAIAEVQRKKPIPQNKPFSNSPKDEDLILLEDTLSSSLGLQVEIDNSEDVGKVLIHFNNLAELDKIIQKLGAGQF
jgi:ParB family chromosome partitioning protein